MYCLGIAECSGGTGNDLLHSQTPYIRCFWVQDLAMRWREQLKSKTNLKKRKKKDRERRAQ